MAKLPIHRSHPLKPSRRASGARADYLIRCPEAGTYGFVGLADALLSPYNGPLYDEDGDDINNWISPQISRTGNDALAFFLVDAPKSAASADIAPFTVRRPCYLADMRYATPDHISYLIQSAFTPPSYDGKDECSSRLKSPQLYRAAGCHLRHLHLGCSHAVGRAAQTLYPKSLAG